MSRHGPDRLLAAALLGPVMAGACAAAPGDGGGPPRTDAAPLPGGNRGPDAAVIVPGGRDAGPVADGGLERPDAGGVPGAAPRINEFVANHAGADRCEFVEIIGDPDTDYSDYTVLVIEGDAGANPGTVDAAIPLGATGAGGLFATPALSDQIENGSMTLLLVADFDGGVADLDVQDDGTIDQEPWSQLADRVAVSDGGTGDLLYAAAARLDPAVDGGTTPFGGASRIPDGADTDASADWIRNDFDGEGLGCGTGALQPGEALNTPGMPNQVAP